ncbi:hypothetical protein K402DRAFT_90616 [Aulographum hederae CBS 113979]|uniref:Uncharacterized protein n=1 Tax=Aulographum hederae CBS 113979 TaxID=1176131 RepID=A0A6G1GZ98_9PEZI|nr:hypothetical protein K402DRAFT_90616 [Aulographum hederae CBS 113979]
MRIQALTTSDLAEHQALLHRSCSLYRRIYRPFCRVQAVFLILIFLLSTSHPFSVLYLFEWRSAFQSLVPNHIKSLGASSLHSPSSISPSLPSITFHSLQRTSPISISSKHPLPSTVFTPHPNHDHLGSKQTRRLRSRHPRPRTHNLRPPPPVLQRPPPPPQRRLLLRPAPQTPRHHAPTARGPRRLRQRLRRRAERSESQGVDFFDGDEAVECVGDFGYVDACGGVCGF